MTGLSKYAQYIPDREPVLVLGTVLPPLLLGLLVAAASRIGITFAEEELLLLGAGCLLASNVIVRKFTFSKTTYETDVIAALETEPPK